MGGLIARKMTYSLPGLRRGQQIAHVWLLAVSVRAGLRAAPFGWIEQAANMFSCEYIGRRT